MEALETGLESKREQSVGKLVTDSLHQTHCCDTGSLMAADRLQESHHQTAQIIMVIQYVLSPLVHMYLSLYVQFHYKCTSHILFLYNKNTRLLMLSLDNQCQNNFIVK